MSSEIKVDTISENTSANGVAIDSLGIKDGKITNLMNATLSAADLGGGVHIKVADSGASVNANRDDFVIENSGHCGMTILSGTSSVGGVAFGDSGGNLQGLMQYNHSTNNIEFNTNSSENPLNLISGGQLSTNGEVSPDVDAGGLTLDQNAGDNFILTAKSSDVAHGMTDNVQTDSFFAMGKRQSAGGTLMYAMNSELQALRIIAAAGAENTTKGTTGNGPFVAYCTSKSGNGFGSVGANANMFIVSNNGNTKFIVDGEGDIHADGSLSA